MSTPPAKLQYTKPWLSHADQVALLQKRGLIISDQPAAADFLSHLNYYRFSGYCLAFESQRHQFASGTTFEQVVQAYDFDLTLRELLTEGLEVIEVDLRAAVAYVFGQRYGAFGHTDSNNFFWRFDHQSWLDQLRDEAMRSSELFVSHFRQTYAEFPDLPVWTVTEVMSFGCLSKMVQGMRNPDSRGIARRYGLQPEVLRKAMHHLVYIRNLCAHHSRLWDRIWAIKAKMPAGKAWQPPMLPGNNRLYSTLLLSRHLMKRIPAIHAFASQWQARVTAHLAAPPASSAPLGSMGLTANWSRHPVWV